MNLVSLHHVSRAEKKWLNDIPHLHPLGASGSFFALFAEEVVLDTPELDETLDSVDMMHIPHFG